MERTCGNCLEGRKVAEGVVECSPGLLPPERHPCAFAACGFFRPRYVDVRTFVVLIEAEYREGHAGPIAVTLTDEGGRKLAADIGQVTRARLAGWRKKDYFYSEYGERFRRETWRGSSPLPLRSSEKNLIG